MTPDPLISVEDLARRLGDRGVQVIDATWFLPGDARSGREEYRKAHIPGAVFFDIDAIADKSTDLPHMLPTPEAFAQAAGELGLRREALVAVYDVHGIFSAPRVWWTLRAMDFPQVRVLDGGLRAWLAQGRPTETGERALAATSLDPRFHPERVRDFDAVRAHLANGDAQLVDARTAPRFRGEMPELRPGLAPGHMPGARNLPWSLLITEDGALKPAAAIAEAFEAAGVDLSRPIVTTCGSGVSAATLALGLARIGRDDVAVYDGSWTEWASRPGVEIATGP